MVAKIGNFVVSAIKKNASPVIRAGFLVLFLGIGATHVGTDARIAAFSFSGAGLIIITFLG